MLGKARRQMIFLIHLKGPEMERSADLRTAVYLDKRDILVEYASRMTGSREVAEEVVQEAFIRFVPKQKNKPSETRSAGYLFRIVHNLAMDILRRKKFESSQIGHDAPFWTQPQAEPSPEEALLFDEKAKRSLDLVSQLPEDQRVALEMHRFGSYTLEQVSNHLGVSIPTVHRLVRSALAKIALQLDHEDL